MIQYNNKIIELENQLKASKQEILDGIEERKIHEKKGVVIVKELKRTLQSERKRADKLQERLQELLNESTSNISVEIQRKQNLSGNGNGNNNNDSSSVGSWSFMSGKDTSTNRRTSSVHSMGSDGRDHTPPFSPINENQELKSQSVIERENAELVSRLTAMQQEKWALEEKINQLELNNSDMIDDINMKNKIIEYYCMEGRSDPHSVHHLAHNDSKLTVKRVVDFIKDKGDENLREINRKIQRILEETLTKNMHLQQNLETISNELFHLKKLVQQEEN